MGSVLAQRGSVDFVGAKQSQAQRNLAKSRKGSFMEKPEEILVSALPLKLWILRGAAEGGALRIIAEGFDPIEVRPPGKLSLVSCPIALYPASSSSERVSFRQINKKTGHRETAACRLGHRRSGWVTRQGRGYEIGKNEFLPVEDEELESLALESTHTIDIEKFVPRSEIDERYLDNPYYLTPEDKIGQDAFAVIREAMQRKNMVGLGKVVISRRERIVMLEPFDKRLMATTLRYAYEVRDTKPYFEDIPSLKLPDEMVELAEHILDTKTGHFDPSEFEDRYETAVAEMLKQKQAGLPPPTKEAEVAPGTVVNLMDVLRRSIQQERPAGKRGKVDRQAGKRKAGW
jgi:DNA end-binding protein Ku